MGQKLHILKTTLLRTLVDSLYKVECLVSYLTLIHLCGQHAHIFELLPKEQYFRENLAFVFTCLIKWCRKRFKTVISKNIVADGKTT